MDTPPPSFEADIGEDWVFFVTFYDEDQAAPLNLTGAQAIEFRLASVKGSHTAKLTTSDGVTVFDAAGGQVIAQVAPAKQSGFAAGRYRGEAFVRLADGSTVIKGCIVDAALSLAVANP